MADLIVITVLLIIVGATVIYIIKAKKSGVKCIGCPAGGSCSHAHGEASECGCGCSCGGEGGNSCSCHTDE